MRLPCWNRAGCDIELDPDTGSARAIRHGGPRNDSEGPIGFAQLERRFLGRPEVFAVFRRGDTVLFSAGARSWRLDQPGLRLVHERPFPFFSRFSVIEDGRETFSILYSHLGRLLLAVADPTYDQIDEDTDFMLAFLAEHGVTPEWRAAVLERWSEAPAV